MDSKRRVVASELSEALGNYHEVRGSFEAEIYDGKALDTRVTIEIPDYWITWDDKEKLMKDLAEVLKKYLI
jgi:hypothetical protein